MTQFVDSVSIDEDAPVQPTAADPNDSGSFGWAVLGFIIPLVGLILFFRSGAIRSRSVRRRLGWVPWSV